MSKQIIPLSALAFASTVILIPQVNLSAARASPVCRFRVLPDFPSDLLPDFKFLRVIKTVFQVVPCTLVFQREDVPGPVAGERITVPLTVAKLKVKMDFFFALTLYHVL